MINIYDDLVSRYGLTLSTKDVCEILSCHPTHVREMCRTGKLPAVRIGGRWVVPTIKFANMLDGWSEMEESNE